MAKMDWYPKGSTLRDRLNPDRPRQQAAVIDQFSKEAGIAPSYARKVLLATRAVDEIGSVDKELGRKLCDANPQAVAAIWRWLAYDKEGAFRAAEDLVNGRKTVRELEHEASAQKHFGRLQTTSNPSLLNTEQMAVKRRQEFGEIALAVATQHTGQARLEWTRVSATTKSSFVRQLPFKLAWLGRLPFGHFVFGPSGGRHTVCHIVWPRESACLSHLRATMLTAIGLSQFDIRVVILISDDELAAEASAMLEGCSPTAAASIDIVKIPFH